MSGGSGEEQQGRGRRQNITKKKVCILERLGASVLQFEKPRVDVGDWAFRGLFLVPSDSFTRPQHPKSRSHPRKALSLLCPCKTVVLDLLVWDLYELF